MGLFEERVQAMDQAHWGALKIFSAPASLAKWRDAADRNARFVHYTTAEAALSVIRSKSIWMRNALCMNDWSEIRYGLVHVERYLASDSAKPLWEFWDALPEGSSKKFIELFSGWNLDVRTQTFLTCVSEHEDDEDIIGRLSMWRAYAKQSGVAIVINSTTMMSITDALSAYSHPVLYLSDTEIAAQLHAIRDSIIANRVSIEAMPPGLRDGYLFNTFHSLALCLKHPGFREEREWRVVYRPNYEPSSRITKDTACIGGVPQISYKIPFINAPEEGLIGLHPNELLSRIIVGPSQFGLPTAHALVDALHKVEVKSPETKVFLSNIPVRL